jgi:hypothetical protein
LVVAEVRDLSELSFNNSLQSGRIFDVHWFAMLLSGSASGEINHDLLSLIESEPSRRVMKMLFNRMNLHCEAEKYCDGSIDRGDTQSINC